MGMGLRRACCGLSFLVVIAAAPAGRGQDEEKIGVPAEKALKRIGAKKPRDVISPFVVPQQADLVAAAAKADAVRERRTLTGGKDYARATPPLRKRAAPPPNLVLAAAPGIEFAPPETPAAAPEAQIKSFELSRQATGTFLADEVEPSAAITKRGETLYTGNIFATYSDGLEANGDPKPFQFIKVDELFELPDNCRSDLPHFCDQIALYDDKNDLLLWYLQYYPNDGFSNTVRLIVAHGNDSSLPPVGQWDFFDFVPGDIKPEWKNFWFDFPELALGKDYAYISTNMFQFVNTLAGGQNQFRGAVVMRIPLSQLKSPPADGLTIEFIHARNSASLRPTLNARAGMMYLFGHNFVQGATEIEVFSWSEQTGHLAFNTPLRKIFAVRPFNATQDGPPWSPGQPRRGYHSPCPDGKHWLNKIDQRITATWAVGNQLGCAWSVNRDPSGDRKFPHVRAAILTLGGDQMPAAVDKESSVWSTDFGYAYPAVGVSPSGKVGFTVASGGGITGKGHLPRFSVGIFDLSQLPSKSPWVKHGTVSGDANSRSGRWGDYASVRPDYVRGTDAFLATGHVAKLVDNKSTLTPYLVRFGEGTGTTPIKEKEKEKDTTSADKIKAIQEKADKIKMDLDALFQLIKDLKGSGPIPPSPGAGGAEPPPLGAATPVDVAPPPRATSKVDPT